MTSVIWISEKKQREWVYNGNIRGVVCPAAALLHCCLLLKPMLEETTQHLEKSSHAHTVYHIPDQGYSPYVKSIKTFRCLYSFLYKTFSWRTVFACTFICVDVCFSVCTPPHVSSSSTSHRPSQWFSGWGHLGGGPRGCRCVWGREAQGCWRRSRLEYFQSISKSRVSLLQSIMMFAEALWLTHWSVLEDKTVGNWLIAATTMGQNGWMKEIEGK